MAWGAVGCAALALTGVVLAFSVVPAQLVFGVPASVLVLLGGSACVGFILVAWGLKRG